MSATHPPLKVSAAASLKPAFTQYARARPAAGAAFSFAGSDQLAAQIRQGARPDVFASANTELPATLFRAGLASRPVAFATNRLVLATGPGSPVHTLADAGRAGITLAVGARAVPVGSYTRAVLGRLAPALAGRILANVRSDEPDVSSIVGKLSQGGADAGFVYATDVRASGGRLKAIALPARVQPQVVYAAAVVAGSEHAVQARAFIAGLLRGVGRAALSRAGFGPPPP
jgi:molybdate transport system substrate-binding protein